MSIYHRSSQTSGTPQRKTVTDPVVGQNMDTSRPVYRYIKEKCFKKIHRAALVGNVSEVQALLLLHKHGLNEVDWLRRTPLHLAAAYGHSEVVTLLVERKCDLNLRDAKRRTALVKAVQRQKEECVHILLEHGANPNILDKKGNSALHYAAANENESIISRLLLHKANIEARNKNGCTPLLYAVREKKEKIIEFLLSKGANINAVDDLGSSALAHAACQDSTDTVRVLLRHGIDCTTKDTFGWTPDKYALQHGFIKTYKIILDYISKQHQENKNNENNKQEEKKENDKRKEENDLANENAHKDTEKSLPMKLNFEDSCSTFDETVDFEAKVKEGKKRESSDMILEDMSDSDSVSSGLNQQAKSGKTDNQCCSIAMTKNPYSRAPEKENKPSQSDSRLSTKSMGPASTKTVVIPVNRDGRRWEPDKIVTSRDADKGKKTTPCDSASLSESAGLASMKPVVIPVNVVSRRHEPDKNGTRCSGLLNTEVKANGNISWPLVDSMDLASVKAGVVLSGLEEKRPATISVNVEDRRFEKDVTRVPELQKKLVEESQSDARSSKSLDLSIRKPVAVVPRNVNDGKHQPDENVTKAPDKQNKASQSASSLSTKSMGPASTKPVVIPVNEVGGSHERAKNGTSRVSDTQDNTSEDFTWSSFESESESEPEFEPQASVKPAVVFPGKVDDRRLKPDENVTRCSGLLNMEEKANGNISWPSVESMDVASVKAGVALSGPEEMRPAAFSVNVEDRRFEKDVTRINIPGLHKNGVRKSKNKTCNSAESVPKVSGKNSALHSVIGDSSRHESRQKNGSNVYNFFLHRPVKKTSNEKKEINPTEDSADITLTSEIASTLMSEITSLYSEHENCMLLMEQLCRDCKDSVFTNLSNVSKCQDLICPHKRLCEIKDSQCEQLKKRYREVKNENCALKKEILETRDKNSQLKQQNLKQENCCCNFRARLGREEEHYRSDDQVKQQLESTLSAVAVELRALRSDFMKASYNHEREKAPVHKSHTLQDEIRMLRLEIHTMKNQNQEKDQTIEIIKEMNDSLQRTIQLSEERLAKMISEHCEQLLVLKSENKSLSTQLVYEKQKSATLNTEVESCRGRLDAALQYRGQSHKSERDIESHFQETREERLHLEERLSQLQRENMSLQQHLNEAHNKADNKEETVMNIQGQLQDTIRRLRIKNEKQKERNDELIAECNRLEKIIYEYEKKKAVREAQITPQVNVKPFRGTQTTSISQMEVRNKNLETENCRLQSQLESQRLNSAKYMHLYLEESKMRQTLQNSINMNIGNLAEVNTGRLEEKSPHEHVLSAPPPRPSLLLSSATSPLNSLNNRGYLPTRQNSTTFTNFNPWP